MCVPSTRSPLAVSYGCMSHVLLAVHLPSTPGTASALAGLCQDTLQSKAGTGYAVGCRRNHLQPVCCITRWQPPTSVTSSAAPILISASEHRACANCFLMRWLSAPPTPSPCLLRSRCCHQRWNHQQSRPTTKQQGTWGSEAPMSCNPAQADA